MRSEPDWWSHARHHRLEAVRAHRLRRRLRVSVATTTRPSPLSAARRGDLHDHRQAGDVGQRLARQAGRGHAGRDQDQGGHREARRSKRRTVKSGKRSHWKRPYRCCNGQAKDLVSARFDRLWHGRMLADAPARNGRIGPPEEGSKGRMDSFEFNKLIGALARHGLRRLLGRPGFRRVLRLARSGKARLRHRGRRSARRRRRCRTSGAPKPIAALLPSARRRSGRRHVQEVRRPATPAKRAAPTRSARISGISSIARSPRMRASPIRPP